MIKKSEPVFDALSHYVPWVFTVGSIIVVASDLTSVAIISTLNPVNDTISEYAIRNHGWIEKIGLLSALIMNAYISALLLSSPEAKRHKLLRISGILFLAIAVGFAIITVFDTDPGLEIQTFTGGIHVVVAATNAFLFPIAGMLIALSLWRHRKSEAIVYFSVVVAVIGVLVAFRLLPTLESNYIGALERFFLLISLCWLIMAGFKLPVLLAENYSENM